MAVVCLPNFFSFTTLIKPSITMSTVFSTLPVAEKQPTKQQPLSSLFLDRLGMAGGIGFVVLFFSAASLVSNPPADGPYQLMADFYKQHEASFLKGVYLQALAMTCLALFAGSLSSLVRRADRSKSLLAGLILGAAMVTVSLMTVSQACMGATALMAGRNASPELIRGMDEIAHIIAHLCAMPLGVFLLAASTGMLLYRLAPRWLGYLGLVPGVTLVGVAGTFSSNHLLHGVGVLALLLFMVWNVLLSAFSCGSRRKPVLPGCRWPSAKAGTGARGSFDERNVARTGGGIMPRAALLAAWVMRNLNVSIADSGMENCVRFFIPRTTRPPWKTG
jgi:hypothetical protein